jgi:hypothetical protein
MKSENIFWSEVRQPQEPSRLKFSRVDTLFWRGIDRTMFQDDKQARGCITEGATSEL